ncbi:MAG: hypothetical protein MJ131_09930 [Lachnospiraceae bacterium]|nr:hypothetical protein [Lachnospiraceae bacterium]
MKKHNLFKGFFALVLALSMVLGTLSIGAGAAETTAPTEVKVTYDPVADTITAEADAVVYILKSADGVTVKAKDATVALSKDEATPLSKIAKATTKDVYLYAVSEKLAADKESVKPNLTVKAQVAKKVTGTVNYTAMDLEANTLENVINVVALDKDSAAIKNPVVLWSDKADGVFAEITSDTEVTLEDGSKDVAGFNAGKIKDYLGKTIYLKIKGDATTRTSVAYKVKLAKQGKAPAAKVDVKKNSFAIKNGMDIGAVEVSGTDEAPIYTVKSWNTVLPYNKDAVNKEAITGEFLPADKKDEKAVAAKTGALSFTNAKVKAISIEELIKLVAEKDEDGEIVAADAYYFAVRTSATTKKPASEYTLCKLKAAADAPFIYTIENASNYNVIAESDEVAFVVPKIVNYASAWTGIGADVKVSEASGTVVDAAPASYEMAIVANADVTAEKIDWTTVGWKSIKEKAKISEKTATSYTLKDGTKVKCNLTGDGKTTLYIRRAGVKGKTVDATVLASEILFTEVKKVGKKYQWQVADSSAKIGAEAVVLTVNVKAWSTTAKDYAADDKKTITKYLAKAESGTVDFVLPEVDGCTWFNEDGTEVIADATLKADVTKDSTVTVTLKEVATITVNDEEVKPASGSYYLGDEADITVAVKKAVETDKVLDKVMNGSTEVKAVSDAYKVKLTAKEVKIKVTSKAE